MSTASQMIIADFEVVDSAIWAYLGQNFPAQYTRAVLTVVYTRYVIYPDYENREEYLGMIEARKTPAGVLLEFGEPWVTTRSWSREDHRLFDELYRAYLAAVGRQNDSNLDEQARRDASDMALKYELHWRRKRLDIGLQIDREKSDRYAEYEAMMQAAVDGLRSWLVDQGIMENLSQLPGPCSDIPETRREAWREAWLKMRPWVKNRTPISEIAKLMQKNHPSLKANDRGTVKKIVEAGKAGCFE